MHFILLAGVMATQAATNISLSVEGLPEGCSPVITVTSPDGKAQEIDGAAKWTSSVPGAYTAKGESFRHKGEVVDVIYDASEVKATVVQGKTTSLTLRYRPRGGTGMLWTVSERIDEETDDFTKGEVRALSAAALAEGGFSSATRTFTIPARAFGGVVLPDGSLAFAGGWDDGAIMRMSSDQLAVGGQRSKIAGPEPAFVTIDPRGRFWVHNAESAKCFSTINFSGNPIAELKPAEGDEQVSFDNLLFDHDGSMIVFGRGYIQRVPANQLSGSRSIARAGTATTTGSVSQGALDQEGNLWISDENSTVHKFVKQTGGGFSSDSTEYRVPQATVGLAFDESGGLWALNRYSGELLRLSKGESEFKVVGQFGKGHSPASWLVFNPPASWSPIGAATGFVKKRLP